VLLLVLGAKGLESLLASRGREVSLVKAGGRAG
jgi:hypothetical protein